MIIGSGLLAKAMAPYFEAENSICIYAAGVSNSACTNTSEFTRERTRLATSVHTLSSIERFVQFSTCSIADPSAITTPYVLHRMEMESIARQHPGHLIVRLPQVAGNSPNPHTLLNYLYARISRSEGFVLWGGARRNIIDVDDVARIVAALVARIEYRSSTINVANPVDYSVVEIVHMLEQIIGKPAVTEVKFRNSVYSIDIEPIRNIISDLGINFSDDYLKQTLLKYYGSP